MSKRQVSKPANVRKITAILPTAMAKSESDREQLLQLQRDYLELASRDGTRTTMKFSSPSRI